IGNAVATIPAHTRPGGLDRRSLRRRSQLDTKRMIPQSRLSMFRYRLLTHGRDLGSVILGSTVILFVMLSVFKAPCLTTANAAQKIFRVGHLAAGGRTPDGAPPGALREGLRGLGYLEGQNIAYEARFAEGAVERLPDLAAELVAHKVDVIVAQGGAATEAAR